MQNLFAPLLLSAGAFAAIDPEYAVNLTLYHVNQVNYTKGDIANMNTGTYFNLSAQHIKTHSITATHLCTHLVKRRVT